MNNNELIKLIKCNDINTLNEQILLEGWLQDATNYLKDKSSNAYEKLKDKSTSAIEALKLFPDTISGIIASFYKVYTDPRESESYIVGTIRRSRHKSFKKKLANISKKLYQFQINDIAAKIDNFLELINGLYNKIKSGSGFTGFISVIVYAMSMKYIVENFNENILELNNFLNDPIDKLREILGEKYDEKIDKIQNYIDENNTDKALEILIELFKNDKIKKYIIEKTGIFDKIKNILVNALKYLAGNAIEQLVGPLSWLKTAGNVFNSASYVTNTLSSLINKDEIVFSLSDKSSKNENAIKNLILIEKRDILSMKNENILKILIKETIRQEIYESVYSNKLGVNLDSNNRRSLVNGFERLYGLFTDFFNRHSKQPNKAGLAGRKRSTSATMSNAERNMMKSRLDTPDNKIKSFTGKFDKGMDQLVKSEYTHNIFLDKLEDISIMLDTHINNRHLKTPSDITKKMRVGSIELDSSEGPMRFNVFISIATRDEEKEAAAMRSSAAKIKLNYHQDPVTDLVASAGRSEDDVVSSLGATSFPTTSRVFSNIVFKINQKEIILVCNPIVTLQELIDVFAGANASAEDIYYQIKTIWDAY
jgi:hypothetical protein